ncbi:MAG: hypothetical protein ACLFOY_16255 [Desulfatibacillaceae bacterium]
MKKIWVVALSSSQDETLEALADAGVLHVEHVREPVSGDTESSRARIDSYEKALAGLKAAGRKKHQGERADADGHATASDVHEVLDRIAQSEARIEHLDNQVVLLDPLGDFDPLDFSRLKSAGLFAKLYAADAGELEKTDIETDHFVVGSSGPTRFLLVVSEQDVDLPFDEVPLPDLGLEETRKVMAEEQERLASLRDELRDLAKFIPAIRQALARERNRLAFAEAAAGMTRSGGIVALTGYCPERDISRLKQAAEDLGFGMATMNPPEPAQAPTHLENPAWVRMIHPVFNYMGTLPGYEERDVSFWFLAALALFFAMLVGDGGYGLLFLAGTVAARIIWRKARPEPFGLLTVFSLATIAWGAASGTWFGVKAVAGWPWFRDVVVPQLSSWEDNQDFLIALCFVIGLVHLLVAHLLHAVRVAPSPKVLSDLGWMATLVVLYLAAGFFVLGKPMPGWSLYVLAVGAFFAGAFDGFERPRLRSMGAGLANLPLGLIGAFSDLVSYLRLFAVGYATLVIAVSFNEMAAGLYGGGLATGIAATLVLLLGHAMNMAMAAMGVLVHGIRLNLLEFSTHVGLTWSGRPYQPFGNTEAMDREAT